MPAPFLDLLLSKMDEQAARPALVHRGRTYTYRELDRLVRSCAGWLQMTGVRPGDRVALSTSEKLPFLIAHLATFYTGAVSLPLNPRFTREELCYFLQDSGARAAVAGDESAVLLQKLATELPRLEAVLPDAAVCQQKAAPFQPPVIAADDPCLIIYSSGTTGWPKGVVHTPASMGSGLGALKNCWRITGDDRIVNALPLFHVHGLCFAMHLGLLSGACIVIEDRFDPGSIAEALRHGTVFMAVPTMYYRLLEQPGFLELARSWSRVRLFTCGSAPIRPEVLPELESILGKPVINRYGMTEAFVITSLPPDGPWPQGSVGLPLEGIEVAVVDEKNEPVPANQVGTVRLRGPNLFREYWQKPDATRQAFTGGWFDTGDLGLTDAAGFLTLVGRKNDLIITSGFNVYPQVVERVINSCPGVKESAVVGLPDRDRGEKVAAAVVRIDQALDEAGLRAYWTERLVDYQRPRQVVFVDALPRNAMGKVLRREVRELFQERPQ
jgi:malonyl-CoA/methylmalonyl-CoA synthetase